MISKLPMKFIFFCVVVHIFINVSSVNAKNKYERCKEKTKSHLLEFVHGQWGLETKTLRRVKEQADLFDIPPELILSVILVEDLRFIRPTTSFFDQTYFKATLKSLLPNYFLSYFGKSPIRRKSQLGNPHLSSVNKSIIYLKSIGFNNNDINLQSFSRKHLLIHPIHGVALVLKSIILYWKRNGYDLLRQNEAIKYQKSRNIGILVTLYSMIEYSSTKKEFIYKNGSLALPHAKPLLGGTKLWGCNTFGSIAKDFIDLGLHNRRNMK
jgi:hypothetical protein